MDILRGYDDPPRSAERGTSETTEQSDGDPGMQPGNSRDASDGPSSRSMSAKDRFVASLPARFRPPPGQVVSSPDPNVASVVRKWLELKEQRGVVITQDLRKRHWYKSPDMMMTMLDKFGIDDRGTLLDVDMTGTRTRDEVRALWKDYEDRRSKERAEERRRPGGSTIEFSKQAAVQAALQAARDHALKSGCTQRDGKRQKR
jgi:hypothetical protein